VAVLDVPQAAFLPIGIILEPWIQEIPMRRLPLKALFEILALNKTEDRRLDWDRVILIFSTAVTVGLIALYVYGKATSRW
jgi:hypothetical protein